MQPNAAKLRLLKLSHRKRFPARLPLNWAAFSFITAKRRFLPVFS